MIKTIHIGLDDTDSTKRGCTTYIAALLAEKLEKLRVKFVDYPNLVRLNPNVPWKTRGNGALCLRLQHEEHLGEHIKKLVVDLIEEYADLDAKGTDPGVVFFERTDIPDEVLAFAKKTETSIETLKEATNLINKYKAEAVGFNTCRGIIGALAAIGETLQGDFTYELIAYRTMSNRGTKRQVDNASIFGMDEKTKPYTFNNVDLEKCRVIITPRGPDPILFGIRGESPEIIKQAFSMVKPLEAIERWVIFRTNQGTDAHLTHAASLSSVEPYHSIIARGVVSKGPHVVPVRHVIFSIRDTTAKVDCAAYEPTGELRKAANALMEGDQVEVCGAVRRQKGKPLTINLEKIKVLLLTPDWVSRNPKCPSCGGSTESMGKGQRFRCKKCGTKLQAEKIRVAVSREIHPELYITSTRSQRHLTKPLRRYGLEKDHFDGTMVNDWHS